MRCFIRKSFVVPAAAVAVLLASAASGCAVTRTPTVPMAAVAHAPLGPTAARGLIVLLPGYSDRPVVFEDEGFVDAVRRLAPQYDVIAADAHFGYYRGFTVLDRLEADVVGPALAAGYEELWLVGVSMGGTGALGYARAHAERVDGVILLAPYLGSERLLREIAGAGGLAAWDPGPLPLDERVRDDYYRALWGWLKGYADGSPMPRLLMGWGAGDHLAPGFELLAEPLSSGDTAIGPGGHDWPVWRPLFESLLPRLTPPAEMTAAPAAF